jgi:hypothetical protein
MSEPCVYSAFFFTLIIVVIEAMNSMISVIQDIAICSYLLFSDLFGGVTMVKLDVPVQL